MWRFNIATRQPEKVSSDGDEASSSEEEQPSCFDTTEFGKFLDVGKDKLSVRYTGNGLHDNDVGSIQANQAVPRKQPIYYYEMTITDAGERGLLAIGFAEKGFKLGRHPGWEPNSYGYHSDDGKKLTGVISPARSNGEEYGPTFTAGDTVGAGILLERQDMFFTKNGRNLGPAFRNVLKVPLFPTIGLHSRNEAVEVNFGQKPFVFDLDTLLQEERSQREQAVQSLQVSSGVSHQVVRDYLLHFGYAKTLSSFLDSAGLADGSADASTAPSTSSRAEETLPLRHSLRTKFMAGKVEEACKLLETSGHSSFLGTSTDDADLSSFNVYFFVKCLAFIELLGESRITEAVEYARLVLSPLRGIFASRSPAYDAMLADVVALLAYVVPEGSPMRQLLGKSQREAVADMVNSAVLEAASSSGAASLQSQPQAVLEKLLKQLVAVQEELHVANGGHGQVFRLLDHLMPQTTAGRGTTSIGNGSAANGFSAAPNGTGNGYGHTD